MKKLLSFSLIFILVLSLLTGCGSNEPAATEEPAEEPAVEEPVAEPAEEAGQYKDGIYFAQEDGFAENGWKYMATIEVEGGKIVSAEWNGANVEAGVDKITSSTSGDYGMVAKGGAQAEWHEQAALAEAFLIEKQDPTAISYTDDEGHTDAISGVSIHVVEFFDLAEKALANGPIGSGQYEDGHYYAEQDAFDGGWKYFADLTVVNGYIVAADWDALAENGGDSKDVASANGAYGMVAKAGAQAEWHEQAALVEAHLLDTQDPTDIALTDDGKTDAISGVSITVSEFFELAEEALNNGPVK